MHGRSMDRKRALAAALATLLLLACAAAPAAAQQCPINEQQARSVNYSSIVEACGGSEPLSVRCGACVCAWVDALQSAQEGGDWLDQQTSSAEVQAGVLACAPLFVKPLAQAG